MNGCQEPINLKPAQDASGMIGTRSKMTKLKSKQCYSRQKARKIYTDSGLFKMKSNLVVHHIDGNPMNNDLNNLQLMKIGDHVRYHISKYWENQPHVREKTIMKLEYLINLYNMGWFIDPYEKKQKGETYGQRNQNFR